MEKQKAILDIRIQDVGYGLYLLRVGTNLDSSEIESRMRLTPDDQELQLLLDKVQSHRGESESRLLGRRLFDAILGQIFDYWMDFLSAARTRSYKPIVRLRISAPELMVLPWEMMVDRKDVPLGSYASLVRYEVVPLANQSMTTIPPLRLLHVTSAPVDYPPIDGERQAQLVRSSLKQNINQIQVQFMHHITVAQLQEQLRQNQVDIFYFDGHAYSDSFQGNERDVGTTGLVFEDEQGRSRRVSVQMLSMLLDEIPVVILSTQKTLPSLSISLIRMARVQSVLSYQAQSVEADSAFWRIFYERLSQGFPLDEAVFEAQRWVLVENVSPIGGRVNWSNSILTLSGDGSLFDLPVPHKGGISQGTTPFLVETFSTASTRDPEKDIVVLIEQREAMEKLMAFYGGRANAPDDLVKKWDILEQQISALRARR